MTTSNITIQQTMDAALAHHRARRYAEAEGLYRQVLARQPDHVDALHLLGVLAHDVGKNDIAASLIRRAVALQPDFAEAHYNLAMALMRSGQIDAAIDAYRRAIAIKPNHPDSYNNLGNALERKGLLDESIAAYRQAIALRPDFFQVYSNLGNVLHRKGLLEEAAAAHRQAIALNASYPDAYCNLGNVLVEQGKTEDAISAHQRAVALNPKLSEAHSGMSNALRDKGLFDEAEAASRRALAHNPSLAEAHSNLGNALSGKGQLDEAIAAYRQAIVLNPNYHAAHSNLGNVLRHKGRLDEGIVSYRQAIAIRADYAEAWTNLGIALREKGEFAEALAACSRAVELKPNLPEAHNNLGNVLKDHGQLDQAIAAYHQAIALKPDYAEAHFNVALVHLLQGDFARGLLEYEWRWKCEKEGAYARPMSQPAWDGGPLEGRTLLLLAEQGFGDTLQFTRYLSMVEVRGGKIVVECQPALLRLIEGMPGRHQCVSRGSASPAFDVYGTLMGLPLTLGTTLKTIPANVPYLFGNSDEMRAWSRRMRNDDRVLKVGLAWAGSPTHKEDRLRSLRLSQLAPLGEAGNVSFYSLQKGDAGKQAQECHSEIPVTDWTGELNDFQDTASLIANLDLVICVDTSVAHLAGAMGKPVWVMLSTAPDWRWLLEREDSPWYPTLRLFRQSKIGDWDGVIRRVAEALRGFSPI